MVHSATNVPTLVQAWGPTLILLVLGIAFLAIFTRGSGRNSGAPRQGLARNDVPNPEARDLRFSLESATRLNPFSANTENDPTVHLLGAVNFSPAEYETAANAIAETFARGRVVIIDLSSMRYGHAARLVDFCSGMAATRNGWIFCATNSVIIVTPSESYIQ